MRESTRRRFRELDQKWAERIDQEWRNLSADVSPDRAEIRADKENTLRLVDELHAKLVEALYEWTERREEPQRR
jgi:hypothetical protein